MKRIIVNLLSATCSKLLSILRNYQTVHLSREEIRNLKISFSQFGEDLIILRLLRKLNPNHGIYVDVGAFHPITISNTLLLYKQGWHGINIDLEEEKIERFKLLRPRDYSVVAAISDQTHELSLLKYPGEATNRVCSVKETNQVSIIGEKPIQELKIKPQTLTEILQNSPFADTSIHYLNIDCEGHDFHVLNSLDFERYSPKVISIEVTDEQNLDTITHLLDFHGYSLAGMTDVTKIFVSKDLRW